MFLRKKEKREISLIYSILEVKKGGNFGRNCFSSVSTGFRLNSIIQFIKGKCMGKNECL